MQYAYCWCNYKNCYIHFQFISLHCKDYLNHSETLSFSQLLTERSGKVTGWQLKICNLATFKSHFCWLNSRVSSCERYWNFLNKELSHQRAQIRRSPDSSTPPILHAWFFGGGGCQGIPPLGIFLKIYFQIVELLKVGFLRNV